jgi:hypothetical protein
MLKCDCHPNVAKEERQQRLACAVSILDNNGLVAAYRALGGGHHVPHLGPAFFSKVLYFADASLDHGADEHVSALILDRTTAEKMIKVSHEYARTRRSLSSEQDEAIRWVWDRSDWTDHRYGVYCRWADRCARYMAKVHGWPQNADLIELALFTIDGF